MKRFLEREKVIINLDYKNMELDYKNIKNMKTFNQID